MKKTILFVIILILASWILNGCSAFQSSRKIDMAPFSENASTLFGEAMKVSRTYEWKHLKRYTTIPEFQNLNRDAVPLLKALSSIVYYSNQVVAISNSSLSEKDKNKQLAIYLYEVLQKARVKASTDTLKGIRIDTDQVLSNIRQSDTYLEGISAASPLINVVVSAIQEGLDKIQADIPYIINGFDREIEKDFSITRENFLNLKKLQGISMKALNYFYQARLGSPAAFDSLRQIDASVRVIIPDRENISKEQIKAVEIYLIDRLNTIDAIIHQLDDDLTEYRAKRAELEDWRIQVDEKIRIARLN